MHSLQGLDTAMEQVYSFLVQTIHTCFGGEYVIGILLVELLVKAPLLELAFQSF